MNDPLAQYRRKQPSNATTETPPPKAPEEYLAFDAKDKVERLSIRYGKADCRTPSYDYLLDIAHDGKFGTRFVLYYSFMMVVTVDGKNLNSVIMAIQMGTAEFIQEYDPDRWPLPKDSKAPVIESIKIAVEQGGPSSDPQNKAENGKERGRSLH